MGSEHYWLYGWFDQKNIKTINDAQKILMRNTELKEITKISDQWWNTNISVGSSAPNTERLVAGSGLDLASSLTCPSPECRKRQVDILFRHAWHYFDEIALPDAVGSRLLHRHLIKDHTSSLKWLLSHIEVALYLRDLGAQTLVTFYPQPHASSDKHKELRKKLGFNRLHTSLDLIQMVTKDAQIDFSNYDKDSLIVKFAHPMLEVRESFIVKRSLLKKATVKERREIAVRKILTDHLNVLATELESSEKMRSPLGTLLWTHGVLLKHLNRSVLPEDVALHLMLPSLENISIKDLLRLRRDEKDSFEKFKFSIHQAINEKIKRGQSSMPAEIAREIYTDIVQPELVNLKNRFHAAGRALKKRTGVAIVLGGLTVTCGVILGSPVATMAGIGSLIASAGVVANKHIDEKQKLETNNMYFLWKAIGHADKRK